LDEHIHSAIAVGLRAQGIDVTTTTDAGLAGARDDEHLAFALAQDRVMVTHDDDYLSLHAGGVTHAGIAFCRFAKYSIGQHLTLLILLHACYTSQEMHGRVEYL
jgi:hypothetical protein